MSEALTSVPSRREKHKTRTRQALRETALQLFASQGYDSTTAEEIAEKVGVSARTFFRYFSTKESALFIGRHGWIESFGAMYLDQPAELTDVEALLASYVLVAPQLTRTRRALQLYERAVASSPALRGREQDYREADLAALAGSIATRRRLAETDEDCYLLAAVSFLTHRRALDIWLAGPASASLGDAITDEFERLVRLFSEHA